MVVLLLASILVNVWLLWRVSRPNGTLHIDEYPEKDSYRMLYLTPLDELKRKKILVLTVATEKHDYIDYRGEDYEV